MSLTDELSLLIRSKYKVVYIETVDEDFVTGQIRDISDRMRMAYFHWSATEGLRRPDTGGGYYQSADPAIMLKTLLSLAESPNFGPALVLLKDFHKYLENDIVLRLFKDFLSRIRDVEDTVVIMGPEYKLPVDIEPLAARVLGGIPDENEIAVHLRMIVADLARNRRGTGIALGPDEMPQIVRSLKGLSLPQIRNAVMECVVNDGVLNMADLGTIEAFKKKALDRDGWLEYCAGANPGDIAGFDNLKRWIAERSAAFHHEGPAGLPAPKGVLLLGVQGCGKSLAARAIAGALSLPLYRLDPGSLYSPYIGQTEQNLRRVFMLLEKLSPLCLWIDEIEKGFAVSDGQVDGGVSQRVLGSFLTWMQERKYPCFVTATANDVTRLPAEFLRKGRFDEIFFVDLPGEAEREALFRIHLANRAQSPDSFDIPALVAKAEGFSGAEIEQAIISALYSASSHGQPPDTSHILERLGNTKPLSVMRWEDIAALREWARERTVPA